MNIEILSVDFKIDVSRAYNFFKKFLTRSFPFILSLSHSISRSKQIKMTIYLYNSKIFTISSF